MTGLLNRRGAIRALGSRNEGDGRVIAFIDCDRFQQVNDEHGRDVGDEFLQAIAGRLRHALPARDTVARWGGDEFLVVVTAEPQAAVAAIERVIDSINGHPIRTSAGSIDTTLSAGAAPWQVGQVLEEAIAGAGRALRTAKEAGGGQVVLDAGPAMAPEAPSSAAGDAAAND
jgi:diguanylate cyclase (GGDEF)-like protein